MSEPTDKQREDFAKDPRNILWFAGASDGEYIDYDDRAQSLIGRYLIDKWKDLEALKDIDPEKYKALKRYYRYQHRVNERIAHNRKIAGLLKKKPTLLDVEIDSFDGLEPGDILEIAPPDEPPDTPK